MEVGEQADERPIRRVAGMIGLSDDHADEYLGYHRAVWPEVLAALIAGHVTNYSIYRHGTLLFSYFEYRGIDYDADMARIAEDAATQRWWAIMKPLQRSLRRAPEEPWWTDLEEIFHLG